MKLRQYLTLSATIAGFLTLPAWSEEDHDHDHGHGDLAAGHAGVIVAFEDSELHLHLYDHETEGEWDPSETVLAVPEEAESTVPDNADFAFLGNVGDPLWILPQNAQSDVLFLGVEAGEMEAGVLMDDVMYVELVSVEGPGNFFVYNTDGFGVPNVMINAADGITSEDRLTVPAGAHFHVDWAFTAEGDYGVTFIVKAMLADGTPIESAPTTLAFEVGHHEDDHEDDHDHDHGHGHGDLAAGHAGVIVAFEDSELHLHLYDHETEGEWDPSETVLAVPEEAESTVPDNADFAFLGNVGDPLWILPQNAQSDVLFLGVEAGEMEAGVLMDDVMYVELVSVEGPGNFFVYNTDGFGVPNVMINAADGITSEDRLTVPAGAHFHVDWAFTAEGDYGVTFIVKAVLADGTPIQSDPTALSFEVGHHHEEGGLAFTFETFEVPGATATTISDIQNDGTLIGRYIDSAGISQGFIQNGELTTFNITGITNTFPGGMNSAGQIAGFYRDAADPEIQYGFIREPDGTITSIEPEGQTFTYAWRINDSGQVNGYWFEDDPFFIRSFQRATDGTINDFVFEGSPTGTVTRGLNNAGVQVGWKWTEDFSLQGITWDGGTFSEPFTVDDWAHALPGDINDKGEIAGTVNDASFTRNAGFFRNADGEITVFNPPGATSVEVFGLNDNGYIVGEYADASGKALGFIAHPAASLAQGHADIGIAYEDGHGDYDYEKLTADGRPMRYLLDSNDQGDMVGSVPSEPAGSLDGFKRSADGSTSFWMTPNFLAYPTAINNAGTIVGTNIPLAEGPPQGFIRSSEGIETSYNFPEAIGTIPFGINNDDVVSGFYITPEGRKGFVRNLSETLSRTVEFPDAAETQLYALNDLGLVGGASWDSAGVASPFLYDITTEAFTPLPKPTPDDNYVVSSVNESGDAIVFGLASAELNFADVSSFFYDASEGTLSQLNVPGAVETYGYDLRDDGSVLGYYQKPDGSFGGFSAVPAGSELELHIHDEETDTEYAPSAIVIRLNPDAEQAIPETPGFGFLGDPDYSVWILPQSFDEHLPFLGLAAEEVPAGMFVDDLVTLELVSVDASGDFFAYTTDGFGNVTVMMDSANGIDPGQDKIPAAVGSHQHLNWAFNASGTYRIGFRVTGALQAGGEVTSETMFVTFTVPDALRTQPEPDPDGDIVRVRQGEVDLGVAFEDGAFDLHLHDHAADIEYEADEARVFASDVARSTVPEDANFSFLGMPNQTVWILPQRENPLLPYLGVAGEEIEDGLFQDNKVELTFVGLSGPGDMSMYVVDGFGTPVVYFNSGDGLTESDRYEVGVGSHAHVNWAFTAPGIYEVTLRASGTLIDGGAVQSDPTTFVFEVEPSLADVPFDQWILDNFGATPGDEAGAEGNPDMDDLDNVLEFAFGTDPNMADSTELVVIDDQTLTTGTPTLSVVTMGDDVQFTVRFVRRKDAESAGLAYTAQFSRDMVAWEASAQVPTVVATQGEYEVVEVDYPFALSDGRKPHYFRVLAELSN